MIRVLDRIGALILLMVVSPLLGCAVIAIRLSSPGPVLYRARRAGAGGVPFTMYKLRTMHEGTEGVARITASRDPRVFAAGHLLRRAKLDELPQLVNVLRGEMSLVGPRPEDPSIVEEHYNSMMWETLAVPPGLTSPGSLHYFADENMLPDDPSVAERIYLEDLLPQKIALDLVYVRHRSVRYYLEVLARTTLAVLGMDWPFRVRAAWERAEARRYLDEAENR